MFSVVSYPGEDGGTDALIYNDKAKAEREYNYLKYNCHLECNYMEFETHEQAVEYIDDNNMTGHQYY